ncbi:hypothetical protein FSHL1_002526 [Fusarium sambucinum]
MHYNPHPNLKEIRIRAKDIREAFVPAYSLDPIFFNSNVKTLRTLGIDWYICGWTRPGYEWYPCDLECLELKQTVTDASTFKVIMTIFPKLKSLSVELADLCQKVHDGDSDPIHDFDIDVDRFGDVLREHGGNLEEFSFSTSHFQNDFNKWFIRGSIGSLHGLTKLRHLKFEYGDFLGEFAIGNIDDDSYQVGLHEERLSDILPTSIETLYLYNGQRRPTKFPGSHIANASNPIIKAFLAESETCAPNLQKVVVEWFESESTWGKICKRDWSRETIDDRWDITLVKEEFDYLMYAEGCEMAHVIFTKR